MIRSILRKRPAPTARLPRRRHGSTNHHHHLLSSRPRRPHALIGRSIPSLEHLNLRERDGHPLILQSNLDQLQRFFASSAKGGKNQKPELFSSDPISELSNLYRTKFQKVVKVSDIMKYDAVTHGSSSKRLWTANFECPLSGQVFYSGMLLNVDEVFRRKLDGGIEIGRSVWYNRRNVAGHAAAARALDQFRYELNHAVEPRLCSEDPSLERPMKLPSSSPDVKPTTSVEEDYDEENDDEKETPATQSLYRNSPMWELDEFYRSNYSDKYKTKVSTIMEPAMKSQGKNQSIWTCQFTCPISNRVFKSGSIRGKTAIRDDQSDTIFYSKKAHAIQSSAARALDLLRFEQSGKLEPRICEEDPLDEAKPTVEDTDDESEDDEVPVKEIEKESPQTLNQLLPNPLEMVEFAMDQESEELENLQHDSFELSHEFWQDEDEEIDEAVVVNPSARVGPDESSPAMRILSSVAGRARSRTRIENGPFSSNFSSTAGSSLVPPESQQFERLEQEAYAWVRSAADKDGTQKNSAHEVVLRSSNDSKALTIAKSILSWLGDANHSCLPRNNSTQGASFAILNFLWQTKDSKPDTEVYNLFMRCLEATDSVTRAIRAQSIVERMKNRGSLQGHTPPEPNMETYNTLLNIWAQVGGMNGRYSKLEDNFVPNRESFLAVLSSSSYAASEKDIFDAEFAKECIEKMVLMHEESGEESLKPDIHIMNAPLRWSGGLLWDQSRPNTRRIEWENYMGIFLKGFDPYSEADPLVRNAIEMQKWVEGMSQFGVSPNTESYEAVVQAWVRTGTREGLEKAEQILQEINSASSSVRVPLRIQTFHPLLAAWLHVRHEDSGKKIENLIEYMRSIDASTNEVIGNDRRFRCLEIAAKILDQSSWKHDGTSQRESKDAVECTKLASESSDLLVQMVNGIRQSPVEDYQQALHLLSQPFELVITAWGRASSPNCSIQSTTGTSLQAMVGILSLYEDLLSEITNKQAIQAGETPSAAILSQDFESVLIGAKYVYNRFLFQLKAASKERPESLLPFLLDLERAFRRIEELKCVGSSGSHEQPDSKPSLVYADRFDYDFLPIMSDDQSETSISSVQWSIIGLLEGIPASSMTAHQKASFVRLCYLLKGLGPPSSLRSANFQESVNLLLDKVVPHGQHRDSVLSSMDTFSNHKGFEANVRSGEAKKRTRNSDRSDHQHSDDKGGKKRFAKRSQVRGGKRSKPRRKALKRAVS